MSASPPLEGIKVLMLLDNNFNSDARVEKEAKTLIENGVIITIMCLSDNNLPSSEMKEGYTILRTIGHAYNAPLRKGYAEFVDHTAQDILKVDFDILHCHDFYMLSVGAEVKKKKPSIKLIYDSHEYLAGWPFYKTSSGINKWKGKIVWKKLVNKEQKEIKHADSVITITNSIARRLQSTNELSKIPAVVGNYPKKTDLKVNDGYFQSKYKLDASTRILVHSGTIYHTNKQLQSLFSIVKENDSVALVFIGDRPRFYEVEKMVHENNEFRKTVFFHKYPENQEETINLLGAADLGILHLNNQWEAHRIGFSNRFVEYVMAGIPVVATPQDFTIELNSNFNCVSFYDGASSVELKESVDAILSQLEGYKANAKKASDCLNWQHESEKLIHLYKELTNE